MLFFHKHAYILPAYPPLRLTRHPLICPSFLKLSFQNVILKKSYRVYPLGLNFLRRHTCLEVHLNIA